MNYKTQLGFLVVLLIAMMGILIYCWIQLFLENIHLGIIGILILAVPFSYISFKTKFKIVRRE